MLCASKQHQKSYPRMVDKSPAHYNRGNIEVWDFIRDQKLNYHLGNAIKYICRAGYKGSKIEDLNKAIHYLENELYHTSDTPFGSSSGISYELLCDELTGEPDYATSFDR
tara:strand:+ start:387 stop:716 length:330 start_codon:yes stop_codon:yes gene_type:complete